MAVLGDGLPFDGVCKSLQRARLGEPEECGNVTLRGIDVAGDS